MQYMYMIVRICVCATMDSLHTCECVSREAYYVYFSTYELRECYYTRVQISFNDELQHVIMAGAINGFCAEYNSAEGVTAVIQPIVYDAQLLCMCFGCGCRLIAELLSV